MSKTVNKKRAVMIAANVLTVIICIFVLLFAIMAITNARQGYNNLFGSTFLAVETESMDGNEKDSFAEGDLVVAKVLNNKQKSKLKEGDIITFWMLKGNKRELNTHRIVGIDTAADGSVFYITKGDNNTAQDTQRVVNGDIVAKYQYKIKGLGNAVLFLQGNTGFLIFIVLPSILAVAYCVFLFSVNLKGYNKEKKQEEKDRMKEELLRELKGGSSPENDGASDSK